MRPRTMNAAPSKESPMLRRPLAFALALALLPASAFAEDLMQVYQLARQSDPQLAAAESGRLATREGAVQARATLLPQVNGTATLNRRRSDSTSNQTQFDGAGNIIVIPVTSSSSSTSRSLDVGARQAIWDRSNYTRLNSQRAWAEASDFQLQAAGNSLITRTSQAYFNVLVALETLNAAQMQEQALQKQFDFADKRLEVGLAPITDVHEARARYDAARASTIVTRNALADALQALTEITGETIVDFKGLPADFQPQLPAGRNAEDWVATAIDNNPALRAKQLQVRASEYDVETARAGHWPTLYASAGYGDNKSWGESNARGFDISTDSSSRGPSVGLTLNVPIFSGGATQSRVRQAIAQRDVAQDELEQQRRALVRSTRNAWQTLVGGISEVEARRLAVVSARSAFDGSQIGLEVGTRTVLDVLNNQQILFNAEREYALARYTYLQNRLLLEQAAGTLDVANVQDINRLLTQDISAR